MAIAAPCLAADPALAEGRQIFNSGAASAPACALCHTLKDAGATGQIGPDLDDLKPDAARIARVIRSGMGAMPAFTALTDAQVAALVRYVSAVTQANP
ncbi:cytochrome c [Variovorax sp. J22R133]|uniref:SorU family sulfite dehydrogenase c-type cytochrome subunit n=1 Tax=Variovorax brevis TaxID=3053503 RepID=UPI002576C3FC|nr:cytochrome c [Variovorax sp. J22R133]MDM0114783.1 cytochrome c [Variovorax sp. J22R133]